MKKTMIQNMGKVDRVVRILLAVTIGILFGMEILTGPVAIGLMAVSGIFVATSFVGMCPIYRLLGIRSCKTNEKGECVS